MSIADNLDLLEVVASELDSLKTTRKELLQCIEGLNELIGKKAGEVFDLALPLRKHFLKTNDTERAEKLDKLLRLANK